MQALLADSTRLLDEVKGQEALVAAVRGAWRELAHEMSGQMTDDEAQLRARRWVARAYALRAATLLLHDASDGDEAARAHAEAYVLRRVARDEAAFETRLGLRLRTLAAFG